MVGSGDGEKKIEEIKVGDRVASFEGDKVTESKVSQIFKRERDHYFVLSAGDYRVKATAEHPFYIGDGKFKEVSKLKAGDRVFVLEKGRLTEKTLTSIVRVDEKTPVYNMSVDNTETFFANNFAVHNKSTCVYEMGLHNWPTITRTSDTTARIDVQAAPSRGIICGVPSLRRVHLQEANMKKTTFAALIVCFALASCLPAPTLTPTLLTPDTSHLTPSPTPLPPTETPAPTATPLAEALPPEAQTWLTGHPEFNIQEYLTQTGLSVDFGEGKVVSVPADQLDTRIKVGQEGALQIYSETGDTIVAAFDPVTKEWIDRDKVIQTDYTDMEKYIRVSAWDELQEIFRLEKHFMTPFPEDTYFPLIDQTRADYLAKGYIGSPLGNPPSGKEPTRLGVNWIYFEKGEGRRRDYVFMAEQIFNPADKTFSNLHFFERPETIRVLTQIMSLPRWYLLPTYQLSSKDLSTVRDYYTDILDYWIKNGLYDGSSLEFGGIKRLVEIWLTTGKVPDELENIPQNNYPTFFR